MVSTDQLKQLATRLHHDLRRSGKGRAVGLAACAGKRGQRAMLAELLAILAERQRRYG